MSDFFENSENEMQTPLTDEVTEEKTENLSQDEESTVFSTPVEHKDKANKKGSKKRLISIIASALAVAVLVGGTLAIIKLIPELKEEETASSIFEDISVIDRDSNSFTDVTVTNSNGEFKFTSYEITAANDDGEDETTTYWKTDSVDVSKLSTSAVTSIISSAANITATREVTTKTAEECGLDNPSVKVSVTDTTNGSYTFVVGDESTDNLGHYFKIDGDDKIYVVASSEFSDFYFSLIDISDKTAISATSFTVDTSENKEEDGTYAYFDSLTLSGARYPETITIENNKAGNATAEVTPYIITSPGKRFADYTKLSSLIYLFSKEISVSGNYAFDITEQTIKETGLDNPDAIVTLTISGESKTFKISVVDDDYCAVIYDDATMIRKVSASSFEFLDFSAEDLYLNKPLLYSINDVSALKVNNGENEIKFDISYTENENSDKTYTIMSNGNKIVTSDFQSFYSDFVGIQYSDFTVKDVSGEPDCTVTFSFHKGEDVIAEFYKVNETKYQCNIDGVPMGRITSAAYNKMIKTIKAQAENIEK